MLANNKNKLRRQTKKKRLNSSDKIATLDEEELIQHVSMRPVIYDRSLKGYRKASLRQQCWEEISDVMNVSAEECRRRWRSLRDSFAKHYKFAQRSTDEQQINKHRKWVFYDQMKFLIPYLDGVSYDLDKILDELGDISEDGQSINCETVDMNAANTSLEQMETSAPTVNEVAQLVEEPRDNTNNIQHSSVSVQATDFMSFSMETSEQQQNGQPLNQITIENNTSHDQPRHQHHCNNHNNTSQLNIPSSGNTTTTDTCGLILDSDEKFLLSCATTMRRLTNRKNALARLKIQQILFDIEFQQDN